MKSTTFMIFDGQGPFNETRLDRLDWISGINFHPSLTFGPFPCFDFWVFRRLYLLMPIAAMEKFVQDFCIANHLDDNLVFITN